MPPTVSDNQVSNDAKHAPGFCTHCASLGRPNVPMELNGVRFVCAQPMGDTIDCHIDDFPVYAAAPELLAACKSLLDLKVPFGKTLALVQDAIAKAEGQ